MLSCLILASWEKTDLLALLNVMFSYVFVTFPYGVLVQACYLVESVPDLRFLPFVLGLLFCGWFGSVRDCLSMVQMRQSTIPRK